MNMLKTTVKALFYGVIEEKNEGGLSLATLNQQIRDAGGLQVRAARKAVALAKAQHAQDRQQLDKCLVTIADLEDRTVMHWPKGKTIWLRSSNCNRDSGR